MADQQDEGRGIDDAPEGSATASRTVEGDLSGVAADLPHRLRADLSANDLTVVVGESVEVDVQILNSSPIIERIRIDLVGIAASDVAIDPEELTLFPGEAATATLRLRFDERLSAGVHEGLVTVTGTSGRMGPAIVPLRVVVPADPGVQMQAEPPLRVGGRKTDFALLISNTGNTHVVAQLQAADANRDVSLLLERSTLDLTMWQSEAVALRAKRKRPWTGTPVEHVITVKLTSEGIDEQSEVRFRQKPRLGAGVITLLTLLLIVLIWAAAMWFGVARALAPPAPTKVIPASFEEGVGLEDLDATAVGGAATGTVIAATTGKPLARVTVEAWNAKGVLVAATATDDDGTYELTGLLPVRHTLRMRAAGFVDRWWPGAPDAAAAQAVLITPSADQTGFDLALSGGPASLGGKAIAGDGDPVPIRVEVVSLDVLGGGVPSAVTADADGIWAIGGLPAPATYRITYLAAGYAPVEVVQPVDAGAQVATNTIRLPAATGSLQGTVLDAKGSPLGGVVVTAQRGADEFSFTTPTTGAVGLFQFDDLATPGTYLLTFAADGHALETRAVPLRPGEDLTDVIVALSPATGTVIGHVRDARGKALGGVHVTVSGGGLVLETDTLTADDIGAYRISGLPLPGIYAVTFDLAGRERATVRVDLSRDASQAVADAVMVPSVGTMAGRVEDQAGNAIAAASIAVSDGERTWSTTTASLPDGNRGRFRVVDLPPGSYTVTATMDDGRQVTVLREIVAGQTSEVTLVIGGSP